MTNLTKYNAADLDRFMDRITRSSIGLDDYFNRILKSQETTNNYPPYNLIQVSDTESVLELALAGFTAEEVNVYTEQGKLFVEGEREDKEEKTYVHRGVAARSFSRAWTLAEDTEVRSVEFTNGLLTINLGRVIPEHHQRKNWF